MKTVFSAIIAIGIFSSPCFASPPNTNTKINLNTYYPSPFGSYSQLRLVPRAALATGDCDNGTMYAKNPTGATQYCMNNTWGAIPGPWIQELEGPGSPRDYYGTPVDGYYLNGTYSSTRSAFVGIGTDEPEGVLHLMTRGDTGTPSMMWLENYAVNPSYNDTSPGPGSNISFVGYTSKYPWHQVEYTAFRIIYDSQTVNARKSQMRIYNVDGVNDAEGSERIRIMGNGYFSLMDIYPKAVLNIAKRGIFTPPPFTNDIFKIGSNADNDGDVLIVNSLGNVGINQLNPSQQLDIVGNIKGTALILASDATLKEDIQPVEHALDKITRLEGVSFAWKNEAVASEQKHMGVIAQNVEQVFPEAVYGQENDRAVDYFSLVAPLIESVKELKNANEALQKEFTAQERLIKEQTKKIQALRKKALQK